MFNSIYKSMNKKINPSEELLIKTKSKMHDALRQQHEPKKRTIRRPLVIAAVICLCILISIPIMATFIPSINDLLRMVNPSIGTRLQPVEQYSEDNGIRMSVIAAMNDDDTAVFYLALQDLTGDRIDRSVDLYDYFVRGASVFTHDLVDYDEATRTAIIRMMAGGGRALEGKNLTVQLNSFLSKKTYYDGITFPMALAEVTEEAPETMPSGRINGGGGDGIKEIMENEDYPILKPKGEKRSFNDELDFVWITGIGYVDGMLHIQTQWAESVDNHGYIYLLDGDKKIQPYATLNFKLDGVKYSEEIFDIPPEALHNYTLAGYFVREGCYVEGNWSVSFEIKAVDSARITAENLDINGLHIDSLEISPMGAKISGVSSDFSDILVEVIKKDGTKVSCNTMLAYQGIPYAANEKGEFSVKNLFDMPLDLESVKEVRINGVTIEIKRGN
jgi:hypothetical protein